MERFWLGGLTRQCLYTARVWDGREEVGFWVSSEGAWGEC